MYGGGGLGPDISRGTKKKRFKKKNHFLKKKKKKKCKLEKEKVDMEAGEGRNVG